MWEEIWCAYKENMRLIQRREVVMRLGYKAHEDSYNALGGTETGWQADY